MNNKTHLIIGDGEVGDSLHSLFLGFGINSTITGRADLTGNFDVLHICFPYSEQFIQEVKRYIEKFTPKITIIHSTLPIGTTRKIEGRVVHSPIRGVHPYLTEGIKIFVKYFGAVNSKGSQEAMRIFRDLGIECVLAKKPEETEALKLLDTLYYFYNIVFQKEVKKFCVKNSLDYRLVYEDANRSYNNGYEKLGMGNVRRPVLKNIDGGIGGHCLVSNAKMLKGFELADYLLNKNDDYNKEK